MAEVPVNFMELELRSILPGRLRARVDSSGSFHDRAPELSRLGSRSRPWRDPTLGHPAARGCKACAEIGVPCSLVAGDTYPCNYCCDGEEYCDLIIEPHEKRPCEICSRRRVTCSFRAGENDRRSCLQCEAKGFRCIAGPLHGLTRTGPSLDSHIPRAHLLRHKKRSSEYGYQANVRLRTTSSNHRKTQTSNIVSGVKNVYNRFDTREDAVKMNLDPSIHRRAASMVGFDANRSSRKGMVKLIRTRYAHPIVFFHKPPKDRSLPYHVRHAP